MKGIKKIREEMGLTQEEFAKFTGQRQKDVSLYELGRKEMRVKRAKEIAKVLEVDWWKLYED